MHTFIFPPGALEVAQSTRFCFHHGCSHRHPTVRPCACCVELEEIPQEFWIWARWVGVCEVASAGAAAHQPGTWSTHVKQKNKLSFQSLWSNGQAWRCSSFGIALLGHSVSEIIRAVEAVADSDTNGSMTFNFRANHSDNDKHHKLFAEFL